MSVMVTLDLIQAARKTLAGQVRLTPTLNGSALMPNLWLKAENMQVTGSFKARGALNCVLSLTPEERQRGLITASAGNHALSLAWAAQQVGCACTVVMPAYAAPGRIRVVEERGATVMLAPTMGEVFPLMEKTRAERNLTLVHPFDNPLVMAGQGTVGLEIVEQVPTITKLVTGIGGGGHIGGISTAIKSLKPEVKIYGVEPVGAATMFRSRERGQAGNIDKIDTIADGLSAPYVSEATFAIAQKLVDEIVLVNDDEIRAALQALLIQAKTVVEPAGAAGTAALLTGKIPIMPEDVVVVILSGGNIDLERLKTLI
jgi:threonine dehydratase